MNTAMTPNLNTRVSDNDIKSDLLRIIQPYDGLLEVGNSSRTSNLSANRVRTLFVHYMRDLKNEGAIYEFDIRVSGDRRTRHTFEVSYQMRRHSAQKQHRIHVGIFQPK